MKREPSLGIIGSGNAAWCLGHAFHDAGVTITEIISRNAKTGKKLARELGSTYTDIRSAAGTADIYLLCVQDRFLHEISRTLLFQPEMLLHCSGSVSLDIIRGAKNHGVLYPVISMLSGIRNDFSKVPVCIEADSVAGERILRELSRKISSNVVVMDSVKRQNLHLAAVFVNNFTNACLNAARELTDAEKVPFDLLNPLLMQTVQRVQEKGPKTSQTGPARRNDDVVIKKHLTMLQDHPQHRKIYKVLTEYIRSNYPQE